MATKIYVVNCGFDSFLMSADFCEATSPIRTADLDSLEDGELSWSPTPWRIVDARYSVDAAARLAIKYFGREWYASPDDDRDDAEIIDGLMGETAITEYKPLLDPTLDLDWKTDDFETDRDTGALID